MNHYYGEWRDGEWRVTQTLTQTCGRCGLTVWVLADEVDEHDCPYCGPPVADKEKRDDDEAG